MSQVRLTGRDGALGKLTSAEKNDAQNWLPASAESTQVLQMQSQAQSADIIPAVVVFDRPSGVTAADQAKAAADAEAFTRVSGVVDAQIAGPQAARDGQAIQTIVPVNVGKDGWGPAATAADELRAIANADGHGLAVHVTGPLGTAADSSHAFAGIDSTLLYAALAVVIVLLLLTYRSPVLWLLPVISVGPAGALSAG